MCRIGQYWKKLDSISDEVVPHSEEEPGEDEGKGKDKGEDEDEGEGKNTLKKTKMTRKHGACDAIQALQKKADVNGLWKGVSIPTLCWNAGIQKLTWAIVGEKRNDGDVTEKNM